MEKDRLLAFSDGVIAIIITIMVLELRPPHAPTLEALSELAPTFLSYVLSFVYIAIYWNNHHHMEGQDLAYCLRNRNRDRSRVRGADAVVAVLRGGRSDLARTGQADRARCDRAVVTYCSGIPRLSAMCG